MPRTLPVAPHLSLDELRHLERSVPAADRVRVLAVRLMAEGRPATEVGPLVGFSPEWVRTLVHRYNAEGSNALRDGRRRNAGRQPLLDAAQQGALRVALSRPSSVRCRDRGWGRRGAAWRRRRRR